LIRERVFYGIWLVTLLLTPFEMRLGSWNGKLIAIQIILSLNHEEFLSNSKARNEEDL